MKLIRRLERDWKLISSADRGRERQDLHLLGLDTSDWLDAVVPGDVHLDLMRAGLIDEPFYGLDSDHCLWIEQQDWWYRTNFELPADWRARPLRLRFGGLDTFATIYLNGRELARHSNMFVPLELDVTGLCGKHNELAVRLASPLRAVNIHADPDVRGWAPERLFARKAQFSYGWDIAPRLVTVGIYRPVELIAYDRARIKSLWLRTARLEPGGALLDVQIAVENLTARPLPIVVALRFGSIERNITCQLEAGSRLLEVQIDLPQPQLWWPHDYGRPHVYQVRAELRCGSELLDVWDGRFGLRTVELVQEPLAGRGRSFYFRINGRRVFLKGLNWTPADAIPARVDRARYEQLLRLARDSHVNALRVWGGGLYEADEFYDLCDELGIVVWQDFMFACGIYPQHAEFLRQVRDEAEHVVTRLRNHPSVILWCGDNENDCFWRYNGRNDYQSNRLNRQVLPEVCSRLDPTRPYIPSSPHSPSGGDPQAGCEGDRHPWRHGSAMDDPYFLAPARMISEMGHLSVPGKQVLLSFMPAEKLWPPENAYWYMHSSDPLRRGEKYRIASIFESLRANGWPAPLDIDQLIERSQLLQGQACSLWIKHFSSDPDCGGILLWNLCDCWPQISDSFVAYPFVPKRSLAAIAEAFAAVDR